MRRIAIVGWAPSTRELILNEPPDVEVWGLNFAHVFISRYQRWFQVHPRNWRGDVTGNYGRGEIHTHFLQTCAVPVYQTELDERVPTSKLYPREEVVKCLGRDYLTSSFAYALGLALLEGVDEIRMFGCDLITTTEFARQRPAVEWMLGIAQGRGIKVYVPPQAALFHGPKYPDRTDEITESEERVIAAKNEFMHYIQGFAYAVGRATQAEIDGSKDLPRIEAASGQVAAQVHVASGKLQESLHRLYKLGVPDFNAAQLPRLAAPPNLVDNPEILLTTAVETPA